MANEHSLPASTPRREGRVAAGWSAVSDSGRLPVLLWVVPCSIAALYVGVFLADLPHNLWAMEWNADFASGFTVPEAVLANGTGGHTVLGTAPLYVALWFGLLTAWLPFHHLLWNIAPTLLFVASAAIVAWSVAQIASRRAAALAMLLALIATPVTLSVLMASVAHNTVYPCTALLGAYLVWLAKGDGRGRLVTFAVPLLAAIVLGVFLASDILLITTGVIPFALTAAIACLRRDRRSRRVGLSALTTVVVGLPIAKLTSILMVAQGYRTNAPPGTLEFAPLSTLALHVELLFAGVRRIFNGSLDTVELTTPHTALAVTCDVVMDLALLTLILVGVRSVVTFILSGRRTEDPSTPKQTAVALHTIYWVGSAATACGAFAFSTFLDSTHEAFYVTILFSVAAVIPLFVHSRSPARWLIPIGASIFFASSLVGFTEHRIWSVVPLANYEADVLRIAKTYGVRNGFAGYGESSNLTWSSHGSVKARPVFECLNRPEANLCIFPQETIPAWYVPKRQQSFLLIEANEFWLRSLPAGLGRPIAAYAFGPMEKYKMFIYPYDIASRLGPPYYPQL
jgi:hypothetical protein